MLSELSHNSFIKTGALLLLTLLVPKAYGTTLGIVIHRDIEMIPSRLATNSNSVDDIQWLHTYYSCRARHDGSPIPCTVLHYIKGLKEPVELAENNAGHIHDFDSHPIIFPNRDLEYLYDLSPHALIVLGSTKPTFGINYARIRYPIPEISGRISVEAEVHTPVGWTCGSFCYTKTSRLFTTDYIVRHPGLVSLPDPGEDDGYIKVRSPEAEHPDEEAFFGTERTVLVLARLAEEYLQASGRVLSVNDMSLRYGGLFDVHHNWIHPHQTHREGKDADINQGTTRCKIDTELRHVADRMLPRVKLSNNSTRSALLCEGEDESKKHLDFDFPS